MARSPREPARRPSRMMTSFWLRTALMAPSSLTTEAGAQVALRPPSRLRMQLLAYLFLARKTAASATSSGVPKRETGIFIFWGLSASGLPSGVEYVRLAGGGCIWGEWRWFACHLGWSWGRGPGTRSEPPPLVDTQTAGFTFCLQLRGRG